MEQTIDQDVVNLAKAIRQSESGGNFKAKGLSGEHGAYQFTPDTWSAQASKYGINVPIEQATPEQQNAVAYNKIKEWKDSGRDVTQIASMWNAGEAEPDAYTGKFGTTTKTHRAGDPSKGVNRFGAKYDVPAYAKSVGQAYLDLKNGKEVKADPYNPSSVSNTESKKEDTPTPYTNSPHSPERLAQYKAEQEGYDQEAKKSNSIGAIASDTLKNFGDNLTFGGASQLGNELGTGFAKSYNKVKGLVGGQDNSQYIPDMDFGNTVSGLTKTVGGILATAAPGLKGVLAGPKALGSAEVLNGVKTGAGISARIFKNASPLKQYDYLHEALKDVGGRVSASQLKAIQNAISELEPIVSKLVPGGSKMRVGNALKWGAGKVGGGLLNLAKMGGIYELGAGGKHVKELLGLDNLTN